MIPSGAVVHLKNQLEVCLDQIILAFPILAPNGMTNFNTAFQFQSFISNSRLYKLNHLTNRKRNIKKYIQSEAFLHVANTFALCQFSFRKNGQKSSCHLSSQLTFFLSLHKQGEKVDARRKGAHPYRFKFTSVQMIVSSGTDIRT